MDSHRRPSNSDRFFLLFSPPPGSSASSAGNSGGSAGSDELQEDEIFSAVSRSDPIRSLSSLAGSGSGSAQRRHVSTDQPTGILALLHDAPPRQIVPSGSASSLHRRAALASATSARNIPPNPKLKPQSPNRSDDQCRSMPMRIPVAPPRGSSWLADEDDGDVTNGAATWRDVPPHEMVARRQAATCHGMVTSSCLEGAGRTLKGRDLRRVRNAVLSRTGFLD